MSNFIKFAILCLCACLWTNVGANAEPSSSPPPVCRYEIRVEPRAEVLDVDAWFQNGGPGELGLSDGAAPFVEAPTWIGPNGQSALASDGHTWVLPRGSGHVHYRFRLRDAALHGDVVHLEGGVMDAFPGTYLLHPMHLAAGGFRMHVFSGGSSVFASGITPAGSPDTYEGDVSDMQDGAETAFGALRVRPIRLGDAELLVAFPAHQLALSDDDVVSWVRNKAEAVARYYRRFPVRYAMVLIESKQGGDHIGGHTDGGSGASIVLTVGSRFSMGEIVHDWTITHEMVHLAFPSVHYTHHWIEEGIAVYVEPIVRVRVGDVSEQQVWGDLAADLPKGLPLANDRGLDRTHTWARTYWGGALFCFVADVRIRVQTGNRRSLDDALRGILDGGGNIEQNWPLERALEVGDRACGTHVLQTLYAEWGNAAVHVDLAEWWKRLGVSIQDGKVVFNDKAPLANVRRGITGGPTR